MRTFLGDIVRDPLDDVSSDWLRAITDLQVAVQGMLRNISGAITDAQDAIARGSRAASSVAGMTNGVLPPAQQTLNERWSLALQQYQGAYNVTPGEHAQLPYNPNDPRVITPTPHGLNIGSATIPWWLVGLGALVSLAAAGKSKGARQW